LRQYTKIYKKAPRKRGDDYDFSYCLVGVCVSIRFVPLHLNNKIEKLVAFYQAKQAVILYNTFIPGGHPTITVRYNIVENSEIIDRAIRFIDGGTYTTELTLEEVADKAGFSIDYFNRIFRAHTGFNVIEYARFRNLNRAAIKLRTTNLGILDIALARGYESHESFTRAFKKQYGLAPNEYREKFNGKPVAFADLELNATARARFINELPEFFIIDSDEVIDYLLNLNAFRFGYEAISIHQNGSCIFADRALTEYGCYAAADMFFPDGPYINLKLSKINELRRYVERIMKLKSWVIGVTFENDYNTDDVKNELSGIKYKSLRENPEAVYVDGVFKLPNVGENYIARFLEQSDIYEVKRWANFNNGEDLGLVQSLSSPRQSRPDDQTVGLFKETEIIGIAKTSTLETHGFKLNNCIETVLLRDYEKPELYEYLYKSAANEIMKQGYILFEDSLFGDYAMSHGGKDAYDFGFRRVNSCFTIEFGNR
jgi:Transcriptional regulator containing an amidase domain and an AraC-type DNA-binding HTH domain